MAIPAFPTIDSVFADWNKLHRDKYGTYVDLRSARPEEVQAQVERLVPELQVKQQEWFERYGDTPEARAIQQEPVPTWNDVYSQWEPLHIKQYGQIVDRPWGADAAAKTQKEALDNDYRNALKAYNEKYGTNFQPNKSVLGADAQPSVFVSPADDGNFFTDVFLPVAGTIAGGYFLGPVLAPSLGSVGGAAAGGAIGSAGGQLAGSGSIDLEQVALAAAAAGGGQYLLGGAGAPTPDGGIVGTPGVSTVYPVAPPNIGVATLPPQAAAGGGLLAAQAGAPISTATPVPANELAFPAREVAYTPNATPVPGSFQSALPGLGVETAASAAPYTAVPGSLAAAGGLTGAAALAAEGGGLLGAASVGDALKMAAVGSALFGQQPQMGGLLGGQRGGGQPMGVDYSGLLALLQARTSTPNVASLLAPAVNRYQPLTTQQSLLG